MSLVERTRKVHFVGVGGIGMSGIAEVLLRLGHQVTGSDMQDSDSVQRLKQLGAKVQLGHGDAILRSQPADVVVYSTAVKADNPELIYARETRVPVIRRAEMLAELMRLKRGIAIAGSHGKTTTTGLVALLLQAGGVDPSVVIGGKFDAIGSNAMWGGGRWLVAEADESDGSFLRLSPELAVVTNIDHEHMDHYGKFETQLRAFTDFLEGLPFYGRAILCSDDAHLRSLGPTFNKPRLWYGFDKVNHPDFWLKARVEGAQPEFEMWDCRRGHEKLWLTVKLQVPGRHNMLNAAAAALVASELEIPQEIISRALHEFRGVRRRFELRGEWKGHPIIEDYAHHPTEIRATLAAAKSVYASLKPIVVFQPHRFTRTRDLWSEFALCFGGAEKVFSLPIYAASEPRDAWTEKFDRENFVRNIRDVASTLTPGHAELLQALKDGESRGEFKPGAPIFVLGAGDISKIIPLLLRG